MEEATDEVLLTFKPAGLFAKDLVGELSDDSQVHYDMLLVDPFKKLKTDMVIGIHREAADVKTRVLVLRKTDKTEEFAYCQERNVYIPFISPREDFDGMKIGVRYVIACKDVHSIDSEDLDEIDKHALGVITAMTDESDDADSPSPAPVNYLIWCRESLTDESSASTTIRTLKPAFHPPIYLGDYEHEIKDPREATDIWVSGLNLTKLKKTGNGKVGYERFIANKNEWKNCHSWTEVLEAATEESGLDIRKEFWDNPEKFPTITARGKRAFITRRDKRKADSSAAAPEKPKVEKVSDI